MGGGLMARIVLSLAEWKAVAHELGRTDRATVPSGLSERIQTLLGQAPQDLPEQGLALELDSSSAETVQAICTSLSDGDRSAGQRAAAVAEAIRIIHNHQQRT
jgi:hypothetical protein